MNNIFVPFDEVTNRKIKSFVAILNLLTSIRSVQYILCMSKSKCLSKTLSLLCFQLITVLYASVVYVTVKCNCSLQRPIDQILLCQTTPIYQVSAL